MCSSMSRGGALSLPPPLLIERMALAWRVLLPPPCATVEARRRLVLLLQVSAASSTENERLEAARKAVLAM